MRAVVQRVARARVTVDGVPAGEVSLGLCVLLGVARTDDRTVAQRLAAKVARLRIFEDTAGKLNRSVLETGGAVLAVSNFTLLAETEKGNRPSFNLAATADGAEALFDAFCRSLAADGVAVERGVFGARMAVELVNDGPVTIVLDI